MNPKRIPPTPILDNLSEIGNPYKDAQFSVQSFFRGASVIGAEIDYEYSLKFLYSYQAALPLLTRIGEN